MAIKCKKNNLNFTSANKLNFTSKIRDLKSAFRDTNCRELRLEERRENSQMVAAEPLISNRIVLFDNKHYIEDCNFPHGIYIKIFVMTQGTEI